MRYGSLMTAMVTPFDEHLKVDYEQAAKIAEHLVDTGSEGIVIAGTTGESPTLTQNEKNRLLAVVAEAAGNRADIIMGAGTNATATTIDAIKQAEALGADAVMLVVPYYNKPSQEGLYEHFKLAAQSSDLPVILYNIPGRCGCALTPETVGRLAEIEQITAIKEASGSLDTVMEIRRRTPEDFYLYSGDDSMTLPILAVGGHGIISVASHVAGNLIAAMIAAYKRGDVVTAAALNTRLYPLFRGLFIAPNPAPVKYAMTQSGFHGNRLRLPLKAVDNDEMTIISNILKELNG